jgi:hypothetical protein
MVNGVAGTFVPTTAPSALAIAAPTSKAQDSVRDNADFMYSIFATDRKFDATVASQALDVSQMSDAVICLLIIGQVATL